MRRVSILLLIVLIAVTVSLAGKRPDTRTMTVITFRDIDIVKTDHLADTLRKHVFIAAPNLWRLDLFRGDKAIGGSIRNGAQLWYFDYPTQSTKLANDSLTDEPMSLFLLPEAPEIWGLAMGQEKQFFEQHYARRLTNDKVDSFFCEVYQFDTTTARVKMWYSPRLSVPMQFWVKTDRNEFKVRYDTYRVNYPFDSAAFRVPTREWAPFDPRLPVLNEFPDTTTRKSIPY